MKINSYSFWINYKLIVIIYYIYNKFLIIEILQTNLFVIILNQKLLLFFIQKPNLQFKVFQ